MAVSRAEVSGIRVQGATAKDVGVTISGCPCRTVAGGAIIAAVPAILYPFPDIAVNLIKPPGVRLEEFHWNCLLPVFPFPPVTAIGVSAIVIRLLRRDRCAPPERRGCSGARHIFPLGLGKQPVVFIRFLR